MPDLFKKHRRRKLAETPVPAGWRPLLERDAPFFGELSPEQQEQLLAGLQVFLAEQSFVGAGGLELTEEMKVVIGATAVRLVLGLSLDEYERLTEIVVYPFQALQDPTEDRALLGVAHRHGAVVLCWPAVLEGLRRPHDGHDTAAHEFAHALDLADGVFDGAPSLRAAEHYRPWAQVLGAAFAKLEDGDPGLASVMRMYGATDPPEFFAVATESFFERPTALQQRAPRLYAELSRFYGQDPAARGPAAVL